MLILLSMLFLLLFANGALAQSPNNTAQATTDETHRCVAASTRGQVDRDEGRLRDARVSLLACARDACPAIIRKSCGEWLAGVEARIPSLVVRVIDATGSDAHGALLTIDGQPSPLDGRAVQLDPGEHVLNVVSPGLLPLQQRVLLAEREQGRLLTLTARAASPTPDAPPQPNHHSDRVIPIGAWVLSGVGALAMASFTYFAIDAKREHDDLKRTCDGHCSDDQTQAGRRSAIAADVSLGIGITALVGAGTWMLVSWRRARRDRPPRASVLTNAGKELLRFDSSVDATLRPRL